MMDLVLLTVVSALLGAMLPGASGSGLRKTFAFLAGLVLLVTVFRPIAASAQRLSEFPAQLAERILPREEEIKAEEARGMERVLAIGTQNIEKGVMALVTHRFGVAADETSVTAEVEMNENGQWALKRIVIRLDNAARCDDAAVEAYVCGIVGSPCVVVRERG